MAISINKSIKIIGRNKYKALKKFDLTDLSEHNLNLFSNEFNNLPVSTALRQIEDYEKKHITPQIEANKKYFDTLKKEAGKIIEVPQLTKNNLWNLFRQSFYKNENRNFIVNKTTLDNLQPLFYYFLGDKNFKKSKALSNLSSPSIDKGLLIIGTYGNGKTSIFKAFETALRSTNIRFKGFTANEVVNRFEACVRPTDKDEFYKTMNYGTRYFDDVKTERTANNFGKAELMKDILEARYINKVRTYITCNFKEGADGDVELALLEFRDKYGNRVYDRLFEMFNIVVFKGESFRK